MDGLGEISSNLLRAELQRRQQQGERPQCGGRGGGWYDTAAHVFAVFIIFTLSTLACGFPLLSRRATTGHRQKNIVFYCQHVGTGVLLATAFVHLLPTAFSSLTDPCLPYFFSRGYRPFPGLIAMISAMLVVGVESYLTARGAGHSQSHAHAHAHDMFDARDVDGAHALDDMEATHGLVACASPLPGSSPAIQVLRTSEHSHRDGHADADADADSEFDIDLAGLDPGPPPDSRHGGRYAELKPDGGSRGGGARGSELAQGQTPDQQRRMMLQCMLLEAGILFHSVFIGMAISVATGPAFVIFLIAISFHQSFEGVALGSRIAAIQFPKNSPRPWLMVLAYGFTTPIGQIIGIILQSRWDPGSATGLVVVGVTNAISSGLLLYAGLVQLLAEDFLTEKSYHSLTGTRRIQAYCAVMCGAALMAAVGAFA
ncbi:Zinc-regulated transporter 2 [Escovopsis weberi]|uniref:Zinc-regulated transporter 2 n=1 Tax=Escovopsis weberi TaxID=150374 RepID=A0A0M9VSI9_ESCWE|nr:Zinc-regulated transporter 2 [Escovopsis weberi]